MDNKTNRMDGVNKITNDIFRKMRDREYDKEISLLLFKLNASAMYGRELYDELLDLTKDSEYEQDVLKLEPFLRNIEDESLDFLLRIDGPNLDAKRFEFIAEKINQMKDQKIKYIDALHKKFFYMLGNNEFYDYDRTYIACLFLRTYYNREIL